MVNRASMGYSIRRIRWSTLPPRPLVLTNAKRVYDDNARRRPVEAGSSKCTGVYRDESVGQIMEGTNHG